MRFSQVMGTYPLRVNLADVCKALGHGISWHLVTKLVAELSGLALGSLGESSGIGDGSGDDAADGGRELENVGDGGWVDELVLVDGQSLGWKSTAWRTYGDFLLRENDCAVLSSHAY